jgi:hypothetical protein
MQSNFNQMYTEKKKLNSGRNHIQDCFSEKLLNKAGHEHGLLFVQTHHVCMLQTKNQFSEPVILLSGSAKIHYFADVVKQTTKNLF